MLSEVTFVFLLIRNMIRTVSFVIRYTSTVLDTKHTNTGLLLLVLFFQITWIIAKIKVKKKTNIGSSYFYCLQCAIMDVN